MKKILAILISLLLFTTIFTGVYAEDDAQKPMAGKTVILHTNDSHGRAIPSEGSSTMGFTAVSALKNKYESEGAAVITIDAGDTFHGMSFAQLTSGMSIVELMNAAGYDVMAPGNHDFNYGPERLVELGAAADFQILAANLSYKADSKPLFEANTVIERNGVKFGIFGLVTPDTATMMLPAYVDGLNFADPIETARTQVELLESMDVDYIIAIGHVGIADSSSIKSTDIVKAVEGIDLFVDGHSHTELEAGIIEGETLIVQTGEHLNNIGVVTIDESGTMTSELVNLEAFSQTDPAVDAIAAELSAQVDEIMGEVVAYTDVALNGEYEVIRKSETNLGDIITDAMRKATGADIAIINSGGLRASIEKGDITRGHVLTVLPFGNYGVTKYITGQQLHDILEISVSAYPELNGSFLQVSGIEFTFDADRPAGERVELANIMVDGKKVDAKTSYLVVTNDYIASGADYAFFADLPVEREFTTIDAMFVDYLNSLETLSAYASADNRIVEAESALPPETGSQSLVNVAAVVLLAGVMLLMAVSGARRYER